jgi:tetratricopeptide (TPR) repeat protein
MKHDTKRQFVKIDAKYIIRIIKWQHTCAQHYIMPRWLSTGPLYPNRGWINVKPTSPLPLSDHACLRRQDWYIVGAVYTDRMSQDSPIQASFFRRVRALILLWGGRVYRHYGIVGNNARLFTTATLYYSRALAADPSLEEAYLERGAILWRELDRVEEAVADFSAALARRPGWPEVLFYRGLAYEQQGRHTSAIQDLAAYLVSEDQRWQEHAKRQLTLIRKMMTELKREQTL